MTVRGQRVLAALPWAFGGAVIILLVTAGVRRAHAATGQKTLPPIPPDRPQPRPLPSGNSLGALARRWGGIRGLPPEWILATILVESGGNPNAIGDDGVSFGLMQINTRAHTADLAARGWSPNDLLDPEKNVELGSQILLQRANQVRTRLRSHPSRFPVDWFVRLAYKTPRNTYNAIASGEDIQARWPSVLSRWTNSLARARGLLG